MAQDVKSTVQSLVDKYDVIGIIDCDNYKYDWVELYAEIQKLYKDSYEPNQRIILTSTFDYYKEDHGLILQSIQTICNNIDISNFFICFVTTNDNIQTEYKKIVETFSIDPVWFNLVYCSGTFQQLSGIGIKPYIKQKNLSEHLDSIKNLKSEHRNLLFDDDVFCIAPWTSLMIDTGNKVRPCCEYKGSVGNSRELSLEQIWNDSNLKNIRTKMLNSDPVNECSHCYIKESYGRESLRNSLNTRFAKHIEQIDNTDSTGCLDNFNLIYLDSRFNNLCNLSCRSCGPSESSSWHKPAVELGIIAKDTPIFLSAGRHKNDLFTQIHAHVDSLESVYFAGGEPLIIEEFYLLLDELDKHNKHNIELVYNTNMTKSKVNGRSIFDSWKNFKNICIGASLDAEGERAEYLRCGTHWKDVVQFRKELIEKRPDIDFYISATTSIINVLHVPDFHRNWVEQGLITPEQFNIQLLFEPGYMRVDSAPEPLREKIRKKYTKHLEWLKPLDTFGRATAGFESILKQLETDNHFDRKLFWSNVQLLDDYHKTNLLTTFPELEDLK